MFATRDGTDLTLTVREVSARVTNGVLLVDDAFSSVEMKGCREYEPAQQCPVDMLLDDLLERILFEALQGNSSPTQLMQPLGADTARLARSVEP